MLSANSDPMHHECDVAICGGGLAGMTLARQLRLRMPERSIIVVDQLSPPLPEAAFKVGESSTEAAAHYLAETLKLRDYLAERHLFKLGFRFFFSGTDRPFHLRPEFGLSDFPVVPSFNFDRGILETDLRRFNTEAGITILEGCTVRDVTLADGDGRHEIVYRNGAGRGTIAARWLVDATGRRRLLQKKLGLHKPLGRSCGAAWFRLKGRIDVSDIVAGEQTQWHDRVPGRKRYYSTNHLMGRGYWVWIIPLPSNTTSVGIVALEDIHPVNAFNSHAAALGWLKKYEPAFAAHIEGREPLDFMWMRRYSYSSRQVFSPQRWACVGDAGVFSDPLFAPGTELMGIANSMAAELIRLDYAGELTPAFVAKYNWHFIALNEALTRNIQVGYQLFDNPVVTAAKIIWDTVAGWSLLAPQIFNAIFASDEKNASVRKAKAGYFLLAQSMHRLFVDWAAKSPQRGTFDFIDFLKVPLLLDLRQRNLRPGKSTQELIEDHLYNMERIEELAQVIFMLAVRDVMPERLAQFPAPLWINAWAIGLDPEKWRENGLFEPTTAPRDLSGLQAQIGGLFRFDDARPSQSPLVAAAPAESAADDAVGTESLPSAAH